MVGDPACGKTALVQMLCSRKFPKAYQMTIQVDLYVTVASVRPAVLSNEVAPVALHVFDTAGNDAFYEMLPSFWAGSHAVAYVYDVTRPHTLDACRSWCADGLPVRQVLLLLMGCCLVASQVLSFSAGNR